MWRQVTCVIVVAVALASCATRPENIQAAAIPATTYATLDCVALIKEQEAVKYQVTSLTVSQSEAATGDAVGVFTLGIPVSSALGGDKEAELSLAKGKARALETERLRKGC